MTSNEHDRCNVFVFELANSDWNDGYVEIVRYDSDTTVASAVTDVRYCNDDVVASTDEIPVDSRSRIDLGSDCGWISDVA